LGKSWWILQGHPANIAKSLLDHKCCGGSEDHILWGFKNDKDYERIQTGDEIFLYATETVGTIVAMGRVVDKFEVKGSSTTYWPIGGPWPYEIKVEPLIICFDDSVKDKWESCRDNCKRKNCPECKGLEGPYEELRKNLSELINLVKGHRGGTLQIPEPLAKWIRDVLEKTDPCKPLYLTGSKGIMSELGNLKSKHEDLKLLIVLHLLAGKNVIVYGPPGSHKTSLVRGLCEELGIRYHIITGNPEWTPYDAVGGRDINGIFRAGLATKAVIDGWRSLRKLGKPVFLIVDEINRANVDLAFGEIFTLLDLSHRGNPLIRGEDLGGASGFEDVLINGNLYVPYSFRVLATMNSYDKALLFKLGYALLRRFALIEMRRGFKLQGSLGSQGSNFINWVGKDEVKNALSNCGLRDSLKLDLIEGELLLKREEYGDYALLDPTLSSNLQQLHVSGVLGKLAAKSGLGNGDQLRDLILAIACYINNELSEFDVEIAEAPVADTIKFLVASTLLDEDLASKYLSALIDEALSSYAIPQLDVLADRVKAESLGLMAGGTKSLKETLEKLSQELGGLGLKRTSALLKRLSGGKSVF